MSDHLHDLLIEHLAPLGRITVRRMFSGGGVYCDGVIVALVLRDAVHFKVDDTNRPDYEAEGMAPFSYETKTGRHVLTSYWRIPERLLDEPDELLVWARKALQASLRAGAEKAKPKTRSRRAAAAAPKVEVQGKRVAVTAKKTSTGRKPRQER